MVCICDKGTFIMRLCIFLIMIVYSETKDVFLRDLDDGTLDEKIETFLMTYKLHDLHGFICRVLNFIRWS